MSITTDILEQYGIERKIALNFEKYYNYMNEYNTKVNLTAITDEAQVAVKHFIDCMSIFKCGKIPKGAKVIDVGTGAGLPGMVMKIAQNSLDMTLMDSLFKRLVFLEDVKNILGLDKVRTIHARAENLGHDKIHREAYDICVSRAVANLTTLSELCLPFVKLGGYFISMKGPKASQEIAQAEFAIGLLGGEIQELFEYDIDGKNLSHNLVIIKKTSHTPPKFPRKPPKPSKEPLVKR